MLPLVARVQKSFEAWLQPGFGPFRFDYNADRLEALADERAMEWERVGKAPFLTIDEQREAVGYAAMPKDALALFGKREQGLERRYAPDQPRVPAGNPDGGQWTSGGGGGSSSSSNTEPASSRSGGGWRTLAGGFTPGQLDMTVQDFVSNFCKGLIQREVPSELLSATVREVLEQAKSGGVAANKCKKLLDQDRFRK